MRQSLVFLTLASLLVLSAVGPALAEVDVESASDSPQSPPSSFEDEAAVPEPPPPPPPKKDDAKPPPPPPPPHSPPKEIPPLDNATLGAIVAAVLVGGAGAYFLLCSGERKKRFKGDAVFLIGPCGGGKTALYFKLHGHEEGKSLRHTQMSLIKNEGNISIQDLDKPVRVIDFPGHHRLRPTLFSQLEDCCAVIFVIDSSTFVKQAKEIAELILDLMTSPALLKNAQNMLVVCNKTDAMPDDLAGILPKNLVRKRLETEIEALRAARASGLGDTGNAEQMSLDVEGNTFKWTDSPLEVEFIDFSAKTDDLAPVYNFICSCKSR